MYHFSFNESYVWEREKVFQINLELQCKISFKMKMQQITNQQQFSIVSFSITSTIDFQCFQRRK
jgi:hypothetical protein